MKKVFPKQIGTLVELQCITRLAELGCIISTPIGEFARYDFIIDLDDRLLRIQCKNWSYGSTVGTIKFKTSSSHLKQDGRVPKKRYSEKEIDYFATFYQGECYLFPIKECLGFSKVVAIHAKGNRQTDIQKYKASIVLGLNDGETIYDMVADERWQRKKPETNKCSVCGKIISKGVRFCQECSKRVKTDSRKPSQEKLIRMLHEKSLASIQREFHIDSTTLDRWIREYGMDKHDFVKKGRKIRGCQRFTLDGKLEKTYLDYYEVEKDGYNKRGVYRCCKHGRKTYCGKKWNLF